MRDYELENLPDPRSRFHVPEPLFDTDVARKLVERATTEFNQIASEGIEAMVRVLIMEKGPRSVLDMELVQQRDSDSTTRWSFRPRREP